MGESLADKIAGILNAAPATFDPEDDPHEDTAARVESGALGAAEEEPTSSSFRKQNVNLLEDVDKRYEGKRSSRKKLLGLDDWESEDDDDSQNLEGEEADEDEAEESAEEDDIEVSGSEYDGSDGSDDENDVDGSSENDDSFEHLKGGHSSGHIEKGFCVRHQLSMWESLLEMRIQLQKCLVTANKLPQGETFTNLKECGDQFADKVVESKSNVRNVLDKLLYLQLLLLRRYPETKNVLSDNNKNTKSKIESDEEIPSDTEDEEIQSDAESDQLNKNNEEVPRKKRKISDYSSEINKRHTTYSDYRNSVIQKWDDKTRIASNKSGNVVHCVTNHIEHILSDREKLIKRTQLKRTDYEIVGQNNQNQCDSSLGASEEYNVNVFDDTDFYHHLLRELIEFKSADLTDPVQLGRQWIQLQHLRSKMKRKIDTKATKGRKIRYVVHSKLVNFMAPIEGITWQQEAKSELYNSIFGKNQPVNTI